MTNKTINGKEILDILETELKNMSEEMGEYKIESYLDDDELSELGNTFSIYISNGNTKCVVFDWFYRTRNKQLHVAADFRNDFDCRCMLTADRLFLIATVGKILENAGYAKLIAYEGQIGT
jgi:hypothetical protein